MYNATHAEKPGLWADEGGPIPLQSVAVNVVIDGLLCRTTMTQSFTNQEEQPIEAVYTFPLGSRATLLELTVTIGVRRLRGVVRKKQDAEERYEEAIVEGDRAIMLEMTGAGLYTMNVGNIQPGEEIAVSCQYAELLTWQGDTLRYHLPTTIAPRYGDAIAAGMQPHQVPEHSLLVEHRFRLHIALRGPLAEAQLSSPSHRIVQEKLPGRSEITLAMGEACLDRDFVLNMESSVAHRDTALLDRDLDGGHVALATFVPVLPQSNEVVPRSIKMVVDCSGSMAGDSIDQARQALSEMLSLLRPEDYFNLVLFGSTAKAFFPSQVLADSAHLTQVRRFLRSMMADMGGTELYRAIRYAVALPGPGMPQDVLLITDGEVWAHDDIVATAQRSGHRFFTVGVGCAVAEGLVRKLAEVTGGACELVVPREQMAEKIVRHGKRMFLPRADKITVRWPQEPARRIPTEPSAVYDGDTVHLFACFKDKPAGTVSLDMILADGRSFGQSVELPGTTIATEDNDAAPGPLTRMAYHQSLVTEDDRHGLELALRYQLISPWTNYLVVDQGAKEQAESNTALPALRKVPQMLAAGWAGSGSVVMSGSMMEDVEEEQSMPRPMMVEESASDVMFCLEFEPSPEEVFPRLQKRPPLYFVFDCNRLHARWLRPELHITTYANLEGCDIPDRILTAIQAVAAACDPVPTEEQVVIVFLHVLAQTSLRKYFNRATLRALTKAMKTSRPSPALVQRMTEAFPDITDQDWGAAYPLKENDNA